MDVLYLAAFGAMAGLIWALIGFCARAPRGDRRASP